MPQFNMYFFLLVEIIRNLTMVTLGEWAGRKVGGENGDSPHPIFHVVPLINWNHLMSYILVLP